MLLQPTMGFYELSKQERVALVQKIEEDILNGLKANQFHSILLYFSDEDTYIRKAAYQSIGKIHKAGVLEIKTLVSFLSEQMESNNEKVRQTTINAAGEIGKIDFSVVASFFDKGLFDSHHSVRNAVIGSIKKMGEKNPKPILDWAKKYLNHPNQEVRREICHGIELRGRTHPQDILPLLKELEHDSSARVKNTLIHVLGQISYKKGCLQTVGRALTHWENKELVEKALDEIVDVHNRYKNFAVLTQNQALVLIQDIFQNKKEKAVLSY